MRYWKCPICGANLDFGESCDCQEKEEAASSGANTESGTGKIPTTIISNQTNFVNKKEKHL